MRRYVTGDRALIPFRFDVLDRRQINRVLTPRGICIRFGSIMYTESLLTCNVYIIHGSKERMTRKKERCPECYRQNRYNYAALMTPLYVRDRGKFRPLISRTDTGKKHNDESTIYKVKRAYFCLSCKTVQWIHVYADTYRDVKAYA